MKIEYDPEADAVYIQLRRAKPDHAVDVVGVAGLSVDVDAAGEPVGIEILGASSRLGSDGLTRVSLEDLVSGKKAALSLP